MKELTKSEQGNIDWLKLVVDDNSGEYTEIFKEKALNSLILFECRSI